MRTLASAQPLRAQAVVAVPQPLAHLVEQAGGVQRWRGGGFHGG